MSYSWLRKNTRLKIEGKAGIEVSYLVLADRDDPVIRRLRRPVEEDKKTAPGLERGKLLYPVAFGRPEEPIEPAARARPAAEDTEDELRLAAEQEARLAAEDEERIRALEAELEELRAARRAAAVVERKILQRGAAEPEKGNGPME